MKLLYLLLLSSFSVFSQNYRITYGKTTGLTQEKIDKAKDPFVRKNLQNDMNNTKYLKYELLTNDTIAYFSSLKNLRPEGVIDWSGNSSYYYTKSKVIQESEVQGKTIFVEYPSHRIKWEITDETLSIQGYTCYKAVGNYQYYSYIRKMQMYEIWEAWFCPDFPIRGGVAKQYGLPGLIFSIGKQGSKDMFVLEKIEKLPNSPKIKFPKINKTITEDDYEKLMSEGITR